MYQVFARKYRPQSFQELVGQEHVRRTLENAIRQNRIAHGYIFSGQRGTGKTTVSRILARCLNCEQGPTPEPCGECSNCIEIATGSAVDVIEIDAASNRGINEIRELRENVRYRPAKGRYKVFIIDEAHQITNEAFNALLKTLEEPPEWVVFILCTTEAHKIPPTIASRCQHFVFRSLDFQEVVERLAWVCAREGVEADEDVLALLAQAGEGSLRDSLSALDQAVACCGHKLEAEQVRRLLGLFSTDALQRVIEAIDQQDRRAVLEIVDELERSGHNLQHFARELSRYMRHLVVVKTAGPDSRLVPLGPADRKLLAEVAAKFGAEDLIRYFQMSLDLFQTLQYSLQPRLHLEIGLLRMVEAGKLASLEELLASLQQLENPGAKPASIEHAGVAATVRPAPTASLRPASEANQRTISRLAGPGEANNTTASTTEHARESATQVDDELKARLVQALQELEMPFTADAVEHSTLVTEGGNVQFSVPREFRLAMRETDLRKGFAKLGFNPKRITIKLVNAAPNQEKPAGARQKELLQKVLEDPRIKKFQELFGGTIRDVHDLKL